MSRLLLHRPRHLSFKGYIADIDEYIKKYKNIRNKKIRAEKTLSIASKYSRLFICVLIVDKYKKIFNNGKALNYISHIELNSMPKKFKNTIKHNIESRQFFIRRAIYDSNLEILYKYRNDITIFCRVLSFRLPIFINLHVLKYIFTRIQNSNKIKIRANTPEITEIIRYNISLLGLSEIRSNVLYRNITR